MALEASASIGVVTIGVADLESQVSFYQDVIGLQIQDRSQAEVQLGIGGYPLLRLISRPNGKMYPTSTGLFHFAILLPTRACLGQWLRHLLQLGLDLEGAADHLVSEALYLRDPEGNGIEIYRDRPRNTWTYAGGFIEMATLPLDYQSLLKEADKRDFAGMPEHTYMGHIHLQVNNLNSNLRFYRDIVGLDVKAQLPGAGFLSAGGYHHHIGLNTWRSQNAHPPPVDALGLIQYELNLPRESERDELLERLNELQVIVDDYDSSPSILDPAGNTLVITVS